MLLPVLRIICFLSLLFLTACGDSTPQIGNIPDDKVVLAFGDSLTYGTGANKDESYPMVLENIIKRQVVNAGVPGELSMQGLERLPKLLDKYQPGLLILCHGGNDILRRKDPGEAERNIRQMISMAENKNIPVILLGVPKPGLFLKSAELYMNIAEDTNVIFLQNLIAEILSDASMKSDTVHPNKTGYRKLATSIADLMQDIGAIEKIDQ